MNSRKAYVLTIGLLSFLLAGAAAYWIYALIHKGTLAALWTTIPLAVTVLVIRIVRDRFYRNGYCDRKQANAFYAACRAENIRKIKGSSLESLDRIYRITVSDTDLGDPEKRFAVYEQVYKRGQVKGKDG